MSKQLFMVRLAVLLIDWLCPAGIPAEFPKGGMSLLCVFIAQFITVVTVAAEPWWIGVENRITPPTFRNAVYDITNFGAGMSDDSDARPAIKAAIAQCNTEGGGTVRIPAGKWAVHGPIHLKSDVRLEVPSIILTTKISFHPDSRSSAPSSFLPMPKII